MALDCGGHIERCAMCIAGDVVDVIALCGVCDGSGLWAALLEITWQTCLNR